MKILLFTHLSQIPDYAVYMNALRKAGSVQTFLLTMGREEYELGREFDAFDVVKDILPAESDLEGSDGDLDIAADALKGLEARLGSNFIHRDILMDRYFRAQSAIDLDPNRVPVIWNGGRTLRYMHWTLQRFEEEMASFEPDFVFVETNSAPYRMAWRLAREQGIAAGQFQPVRVWPERIYLETGLGLDWHQARTAYAELTDDAMTGDELAAVTQKLQTIIEKNTKPHYMQWAFFKGAPSLFSRLHPQRLLEGNKEWLGTRARAATKNPRVYPGRVFSPLAKFSRYWQGRKAKRYLREHQTPFDTICKRKYAMYFLHVQPELTVEEMAFEYQDQVNTLRNILAALPADMTLVVKEHSPMLGRRPMDVYARLLHMPGVILADPFEDSHKLVKQASVVITLTGTVALEAVYYGIPAIVLGSVFFDGFNGIYKPANLQELDRLLSDPEKLSGASRGDALRAIGSMLRASVPGMLPREDTRLQEISDESAQGMMTEMRKTRPSRKLRCKAAYGNAGANRPSRAGSL